MAAKSKAGREAVGTRDAQEEVLDLKVTLLGFKPAIWRRIHVPARTTLGELHYIIQVVMGWTNSHMHEFELRKRRFSDPLFGLEDVEDELTTELRGVLCKRGERMIYLYDFGDSWEHEVRLEGTAAAEPGKSYPLCVAGERASPPDDCGGVWGYAEFLEVISDPQHEEHEERLEWAGREFDPEAFDLKKLNKNLKRGIKFLRSFRE